MNYAKARPLKDGGWHWTTMRDGLVSLAPPCRRFIGNPLPDIQPFPMPYNPDEWETCEPHATKEEAERHFHDWSIAEAREQGFGNWMGCAVCDAPTKRGWGSAHFSAPYGVDPLCDAHYSAQTYADLHPFEPGIALLHS